MKLNWGTSIVLAFIAFISFILYFVVIASSDDRANHDLVTEEYYKEELAYQKEIDAMQNAQPLAESFEYIPEETGLKIKFPETLDCKSIDGKVFLYRPSNKHLDFNLPIGKSDTHLLIPDKRLLDGRWDIKIFWTCLDKEYLVKKSINY